MDHFRKVDQVASEFNQYLTEIHGGRDVSARVFNDSVRKDDWDQRPVASIRPPRATAATATSDRRSTDSNSNAFKGDRHITLSRGLTIQIHSKSPRTQHYLTR